MSHKAALKEALRTRGIPSPEAFAERYGVSLDRVPLAVSLALVMLPDHPRARDRAAWTPVQREHYIAGCLRALTTLRTRLARGQVILKAHPAVAVELRWLRLATRAVRIIGLLSRVSGDAGAAFCESALGRWYACLGWPEPSDSALSEAW